MVQFMIFVELTFYTFIRLFIKAVEFLIATPKHRKLRRQMAQAKSYQEWYDLAKALDISQGRDKWQRSIDDDTSYRYNWGFITELIHDMRTARANGDSLFALAVLQQCTRQNVGGVMSEEIFSYTNTGEPKYIVQEFVKEVVITLKWVTEETIRTTGPPEEYDLPWSVETAAEEKEAYENRLKRKVLQEKSKMWTTMLSFAKHRGHHKKSKPKSSPATTPVVKVKKSSSHSALPKVQSGGAMSITTNNGVSDGEASSDHRYAAYAVSADSSTPLLPAFHRDNVIMTLKRARSAYGRSALCLSGGAMMGNYHFGEVKALLEMDAMPNIVSGTSAGAVVGTVLCTRTPEEIERDMRPEVLSEHVKCFSRPWGERLKSLYKYGHLFDYEEWYEMIQWMTCGEMTFEEAYQKTGRTFCITLSATTKKAPPVLVNHISAPNVVIASAICASAAVPGLIPPVRLRVKDANGVVREQGRNKDELYWDGSIEQDIPTSGLAEMLNCQFIVAAQCNPHIVPFFYNSKGEVGRPSRWSSGGVREHSWRGGFLLSALELYLKTDIRAKFRFLDEVEAAVGFTSTMTTQTYGGSTTIVPQVSFLDYFKLFSNPTESDLVRYFQGGAIAAYEKTAMIKLHYEIADALDECLEMLDHAGEPHAPVKPRTSLLREKIKTLQELEGETGRRFSLPADMKHGLTESQHDSSACSETSVSSVRSTL
jgi:predicted acylesterase/phospholipase RssA